MANRFQNPWHQFFSSTPAALAGYRLFFYAAGTSTKLSTYSNEGLSVVNANPITLGSDGSPPVDIFLQNLAYKVCLALPGSDDPPGSFIKTADNVYTSDYSGAARIPSGTGSPNGTRAGTAGSASVPADVYWDTTNGILYVCTTTGTALTAVWAAINASTTTVVVPTPQGYLSPTSGVPIIATGVAAGTSLVYTPLTGNVLPIYNGTAFVPTEFAELLLTLVASHAANAIYDIYGFSNSGVATLATGPAWTTATAGSGSRGTGAATAEIARLGGIWVNANEIAGRNGATTFTIPANKATYLGTIAMDGTNGQITCHRTWGQSRKWSIWNAYNRQVIDLRAGDSTTSWAPGSGRAANNDAANSMTIVVGLAEEMVDMTYNQYTEVSVNAGNSTTGNGIGFNSTTSASGTRGGLRAQNSAVGDTVTSGATMVASHARVAAIGKHVITAIELNSSNARTMYGTEELMVLRARWMG